MSIDDSSWVTGLEGKAVIVFREAVHENDLTVNSLGPFSELEASAATTFLSDYANHVSQLYRRAMYKDSEKGDLDTRLEALHKARDLAFTNAVMREFRSGHYWTMGPNDAYPVEIPGYMLVDFGGPEVTKDGEHIKVVVPVRSEEHADLVAAERAVREFKDYMAHDFVNSFNALPLEIRMDRIEKHSAARREYVELLSAEEQKQGDIRRLTELRRVMFPYPVDRATYTLGVRH